MRTIISCCGLFVTITLIVLIHTSILSKAVRDEEINTGLESAMDYALDRMGDMYNSFVCEDGKEDEYIDRLLCEFCICMESIIGSDGNITVSVVNADIETGTFEIIVEETYDYAFNGRKGRTRCERAVIFAS